MEEEKVVDQSRLAEDVSNSIKYEFVDFFLVKPLDPIKVKKEFSVPVDTTVSKDENGMEVQDFKEVSKEVREVDSDYRKGVVIKRPLYWETREKPEAWNIEIGDVVIFRDTAGTWFDLVKNTRLLRLYDILGIEGK